MKKLILILFIALTRTSFAQDAQVIKRDFETIIQHTRQLEIDKILDMTYPTIFNIMPKAQMSALAKGMMDAMGIKTVYEQVPLELVMSPLKKISTGSVSLSKYNQSMIVEFSNPDLIDIFVKTKLKDNVIEKLGPNKVRIKGKSYLLAIKDDKTANTWKYLRYDEEDTEVNASVLSKEIQDLVMQLKKDLK